MGICCSKKKQQPLSPPPPLAEKKEKKNVAVEEVEVEVEKKKKKRNGTMTITTISTTSTQQQVVVEAEEKPVLMESKSPEDEQQKEIEIKAVPVEEPRPAAVRTSSCTKEEVDAILIQCGRLSRSSSGNTTNETTSRGHRKHSGSKRSYDFDNDKSSTSKDDEDEDWEAKPVSRPSPRRRTPGRERDHHKRSGSRERGRGGTGSPRVSRSPGRRLDGPGFSSSASDKQQQPGKLVSLPAREKGGVKRNAASSRSNSPAKNVVKLSNESALHQPQSLSRSSSRKGEESPYRRNPMAEIDGNSLRTNQKAPKSREGEEAFRKPSPVRSQRTSDKRSGGGGATSTEVPKGSKPSSNDNNNNISNYVREQLMSCRGNEKLRESEIVVDTHNARTLTRTRSSRRSSKDLDHPVGPNSENALPNPNSYASLLLEDIQNYHQQGAAATFSLPACVSKACSILDAVADLNSTSSDYCNNDNVRLGRGSFSVEPSLHKYIPEVEPQESAGSNSFVVQPPPWASSWEPNSADSTDRSWAPQPDDAEEEVAFDSQGKGSRGSLPTAMTPGRKRREAYVKNGGK